MHGQCEATDGDADAQCPGRQVPDQDRPEPASHEEAGTQRSTALHCTGPRATKARAATPLTTPMTTFFVALPRGSGSAVAAKSRASMRTPAAAPKYPPYTATGNTATGSSRASPARPRGAAAGRRRPVPGG